MKKAYLVLIFLFALCAEAEEYGKRPELNADDSWSTGTPATIPTSVVALLGNPEYWDKKMVSVEGFLRSDLHGVMLFLSSEYCELFAQQYGLLIALDEMSAELDWTELPTDECQYSWIEGEFVSTPAKMPEPDTIVIRQRPGIIYAKFISVY